MASPSLFLSLPREIRDAIYEHYVTAPGGYICDTDRFAANVLARNKDEPNFSIIRILKRADGQPIDLNLSYTCRLVASEIYGVALRTNTITFSTVTSDELRILALRHHELMTGWVCPDRRHMVYFVVQSLSETVFDELKAKYPPFIPVLVKMREGEADRFMRTDMTFVKAPYGEALSLWDAFCRDVVQFALSTHAGHEALRCYCSPEIHGGIEFSVPVVINRIECPIAHWDIPTDDVLRSYELRHDLRPAAEFHADDLKDARTKRDRVKYRFSAAAAAVLFLQSLDNGLRGQLRRVVVHEDREAVTRPQRHALGLIPFCQQNPLLRVERRVDLWRNALQYDNRFGIHNQMHKYVPKFRWRWDINSNDITNIVNEWVIEALALAPAGMPAGSFSLVFDGQPLPYLVTQMFQSVVQRDVAWQLAWEESLRRGIISEPPLFKGAPWRHWYPGYLFKYLPQAMKDIADQKSVVRCNFDVGEPWDVEKMVQDHKDWTALQWSKEWGGDRHAERWDTEAPLPSWRSVLEENLVPIPDGPYVPYGDSESDFDYDSRSDSNSDSD